MARKFEQLLQNDRDTILISHCSFFGNLKTNIEEILKEIFRCCNFYIDIYCPSENKSSLTDQEKLSGYYWPKNATERYIQGIKNRCMAILASTPVMDDVIMRNKEHYEGIILSDLGDDFESFITRDLFYGIFKLKKELDLPLDENEFIIIIQTIREKILRTINRKILEKLEKCEGSPEILQKQLRLVNSCLQN